MPVLVCVTGAYTNVRTVFDALGNARQVSAPYLSSDTSIYYTTTTFDALGRPTLVERPTSDSNPAVASTLISYQGPRVVATDALNHVSTQVCSPRGEIVQSFDAANNDVDYEYDAFGNLLKMRDVNGAETLMTYNTRGMKMISSDPNMGAWQYDYYPLGELESQRDARNQLTTFTYDGLSRPLTRVMPEGAGSITHTFTWGNSLPAHNIGQLHWVETAGTNVATYRETYSYDIFALEFPGFSGDLSFAA
jgi:YD repeat-containing protein